MFQVAKWVGDFFNLGLYNTYIKLKKTPFLEWESHRKCDTLTAEDVCSLNSKLSYLYPITRVRSIEHLLRTTDHGSFPVVTPVEASRIPEFPKIHKSQHTPQLYSCQRPLQSDSTKVEEKEEDMYAPPELDRGEVDERMFTETYSIPARRRNSK